MKRSLFLLSILAVVYLVTPVIGQESYCGFSGGVTVSDIASSVDGKNQKVNHGQFVKQVDQLFKEHFTEKAPGAAVVVTEKGKAIFKKCYWLANMEHNIPITSKTMFNLASVSKQFTAFAILLLEKKEKSVWRTTFTSIFRICRIIINQPPSGTF